MVAQSLLVLSETMRLLDFLRSDVPSGCVAFVALATLGGCASGATTTFDSGDTNDTDTTTTTTTTTAGTSPTTTDETTTDETTTSDEDPCEPKMVESCELEGCSAGVRLCGEDEMWEACSCACPMGGELVDGFCQDSNLTCPEDTTDNGDGCLGQEISGYECPKGGDVVEDQCVPSQENPRTDLQCPEGGMSLVGTYDIEGLSHCGLNSNVTGLSEEDFAMLPECDTIGGLIYRAWEGMNGYTVCSGLEIDGHKMVYLANRVIGGSQANYPGTPLFEDIILPYICPEGWEPVGEEMCQYEATLPGS